MAASQRLLGALSVLLVAAVLAGLTRRGRLRLTYSWPAYLGIVGISECLITGWPSVFWNWYFWVSKELLLGVFKLALGLEIGALAFQRFPGARTVAGTLSAVILAGTALLLGLGSGRATTTLAAVALEAHSRLSHATALLLIALGFLVLWYRVPVHRLQRAVLRGLSAYLLVFSGSMRGLFEMLDPGQRAFWEVLTKLDGVAYVLMLAYWAWEAWRLDPEDDIRGSAAIEARLAWRERLGGEKQDARP